MWRDLGIEDDNQDFFGLNLEAWLEKNRGNSSMYPRPRTPWKILFPQVVQTRPFFKEQGHRNKVYGVLGIWLHRNKAIFKTGKIEEGMSAFCVKKGVEFYAIFPNGPNKPRRMQVQVRWLKPPRGWTKLKTNGFVFGNPIKAGGGSILRCNNGDWIAGFARKLGNTTSTIVELWALKDGLIVAKQLGIENICIKMDADFIVHLVSSASMVNLMLEPLLTDCINLIKTFPNHSVAYVFREANCCANRLACIGVELNFDFQFLYNP